MFFTCCSTCPCPQGEPQLTCPNPIQAHSDLIPSPSWLDGHKIRWRWCSPLPRVGPWAGGSSPLERFWGTRGSTPSWGSICFPSLLSLQHHWKTKLILCHLLCSCSPRSLSFLIRQTHPAERKMSRIAVVESGSLPPVMTTWGSERHAKPLALLIKDGILSPCTLRESYSSLSWVEHCPPKFTSFLEPPNVVLLGNGALVMWFFEMKSSWGRVGPSPNPYKDSCAFPKRRDIETDTQGKMSRADGGSNWSDASPSQGLPGAPGARRQAWPGFFPRDLASMAYWHQNQVTIIFCCWSLSVCGNVLQQP